MDDDPAPPTPNQPRPHLARDIACIVILKLLLLIAAWQLWFSHPLAHHMYVDPQRVDQHLLAGPAPAPDSSSQGVRHDSGR